MDTFDGYLSIAELFENEICIHRRGATEIGDGTVKIPLSSIVGVNVQPATARVNGMLQIVQSGKPPALMEPSDVHTIVFRRAQRGGMELLRLLLQERAEQNQKAAIAAGTVVTSRFAGLELVDGHVVSSEGKFQVAGAKATVDSAGEIRRQITVSRIVLTGVFALGWRKKIDERELYLLVEGIGWAVTVPVDPDLGAQARAFAAKINGAASAALAARDNSVVSADPIAQIQQLAGLRDQGILTAEEFETKKQELLSRLQVLAS